MAKIDSAVRYCVRRRALLAVDAPNETIVGAGPSEHRAASTIASST